MADIRQLRGAMERVETGAVQFGDDWPGLFVRGDEAMALAMEISHLLSTHKFHPIETVRMRKLLTVINEDVIS